MIVKFYQAECGDAANIHFKDKEDINRNLIIDWGFNRTFKDNLINSIKEIIENNELIDLSIVTHIHDDHIGGAIAYIKAIEDRELKDVVRLWIYNLARSNFQNEKNKKKISLATSIVQGDILGSYIMKSNTRFIGDVTNQCEQINCNGLIITILSPDSNGLKSLKAKYLPDKNLPFERIESDKISHAAAVRLSDYHIPLRSFDVEYWEQDTSIENGSSISFLTELGGVKILWLADSHSNVIISKLKLLGYSVTNPLVCDLVKVAHHGSKFNNSHELFSMIKCDNYLFSANGENRDNLPNKECIARILRNKYRPIDSNYNLYFTYENDLIKSIFKVDGEGVFDDFTFTVHFPKLNENFLKFSYEI